MKILTFNVRNRYRIKNYDGIYKNKDTVIMLSKSDLLMLLPKVFAES